jgi:hypothetical protein
MMTTLMEVLFVVSLVAPVLAVLVGVAILLTPRRIKPAQMAETRAPARA